MHFYFKQTEFFLSITHISEDGVNINPRSIQNIQV